MLIAVAAVGLLAVSGDEAADPKTPSALPGEPPPFLGTAVVGSGELTAAVDAYGDVVDLRSAPAGPALIANPAARQVAGTVDVGAGIVPRVSIDGGEARALWEADEVAQRYVEGTNVVRTTARFGQMEVAVTWAATGDTLALLMRSDDVRGIGLDDSGVVLSAEVPTDGGADGVRCRYKGMPGQADLLCRVGRPVPASPAAAVVVREATAGDRGWLGRARPLGAGAPSWAEAMYERSLLALRALTDSQTGAVAAGARDGWAYVWPRDAGTAAIAYAEAGYRKEAVLVTRFLLGAGLEQAARFHGDGSPVPGRAAQGDAIGWTAAAAEAAGLIGSAKHAARILGSSYPVPWRDRADYQEGEPGNYLGNAIASGAWPVERARASRKGQARAGPRGFDTPQRLVRRAGDPDSGLDAAAAWAVRPFSTPALYPAVRRTLNALVADGTAYGITPGSAWHGGDDPWTAPTAWTAWAFAALAASRSSPDPAADRRQALALLADLRRAARPSGALPERVDVRTGVPASTTPLTWTHAYALLALRELWPARS